MQSILVASFVALTAAGCIDWGCSTEVTLKWTDATLYQAAAGTEQGFEPVAVTRWLDVNGSVQDGPWRLVGISEAGDGWSIQLRALPEGRLVFLDTNRDTAALATGGDSAFGRFLQTVTDWNETTAGEWLADNPVRANYAIQFDHVVRLPEPLTWSGPHNGFWQSAQDGQMTYERSRPHLEATGDAERLAVDEAGQVAWWGYVDSGIGMRSRAVDRAETMMDRLEVRGHGPRNAQMLGSPEC